MGRLNSKNSRQRVESTRSFECSALELTLETFLFFFRNLIKKQYVCVLCKPSDFGILLYCAPYAIWKRGNLDDLAQFIGIFGQPVRIAKYDAYDKPTKIELKKALDEANASLAMLILKQDGKGANGDGGLQDCFRKACNEEMSVAVLGNTKTTTASSSSGYAQSKTQSTQQEAIPYRDMPEYGKFILEFGDNTNLGVLNKAVPHILFKRFAQSCWSELCEIYGIPPRVLKTNTQDKTMLRNAKNMMRNMGAAAWFIIDETESFDFASGVSTNGDVYRNLFLFSGFKTYRQLKEASLLLLHEEGKIKPFGQFYKDVKAVHETYNKNYLQAEYIFATSSAQQAANWAEIEKDGDRYDLRYRTAADDRVRQSHVALNDTVLPPSAPFWNSYYPPNGWRCRCLATQVLKGKYERSDPAQSIAIGDQATTKIGKDGKNSLAIFRFNPGKQKVIFPPHPSSV